MIICSNCKKTVSLLHESIVFATCECGAVIDTVTFNEVKINAPLAANATPSFFKIDQTGTYNKTTFTIIGRVNIWTEDSVLSYWTLLTDTHKILILEEGYGNYAILEYNEELNKNASSIVLNQVVIANTAFTLAADNKVWTTIVNQTYLVAVQGQTILNPTHTPQIIYADNVNGHTQYEIWKSRNGLAIFESTGIDFEDLNINETVDEYLIFPQARYCRCTKCKSDFKVEYFPYIQTATCKKCEISYSYDVKQNTWQHILNNNSSIKRKPRKELPVGAKVTLLKDNFEITGKVFKQNTDNYRWIEYHLYNAYEGSYAYLSESDGIFILLYQVFDAPLLKDRKKAIRYNNKTFALFDDYKASIQEIEGNLIGAYFNPKTTTKAYDYVSPPYMLSLEEGNKKNNYWHAGEYVPDKEIAKAYADNKAIKPNPTGYGAVKPATKRPIKHILIATVIMGLIYLAIQIWMERQNHSFELANTQYMVTQNAKQFVIDNINIKEDRTDIKVASYADLSNDWVVFNYTLVSKKDGAEFDGGHEVSYYSGMDDGESWSEGSKNNKYIFSGLSKGDYKLIINVESNIDASRQVDTRFHVTTDGQLGKNFLFPFLLIIAWGIFCLIKYIAVESKRFQN